MNKLKKDEGFRTLIYTVISGIALVLSALKVFHFPYGIDISWVAIILCGFPIVKGAVMGLLEGFDITAGVLVSIALIAAIVIGEYFAAGEVAFIMMIGEMLENRTVRKAHEGINKLLKLAPQTARVIKDGIEHEVQIKAVKAGDRLTVRPGETIPVDGIIIKGSASIDQSVITGESMPVDKSEGDEVFVGTINHNGALEIEATKIGEDSSLGKMIRLVKEAEEKKAPIARVADKWATIMVPTALILAVLTYFGTLYFPSFFSFIVSEHGTQGLSAITRAVTILVVFCPCALMLATPTAIMAAVGNATKQGILIKSGEALEALSKIDTITFDKTGTVTIGKPVFVSAVAFDKTLSEAEIVSIVASGEKLSEHPLGRAVVNYAEINNIAMTEVSDFKMHLGKGISCTAGERNIVVGSAKLLEYYGISLTQSMEDEVQKEQINGRSVLLLADKKNVLGYVTVADKLKPQAPHAVGMIKKSGIEDMILLTGDNEITANAIAKEAGISIVYASQLPTDKVNVVKKLIDNGKHVAMVGDGVNDAPALATATVGIAMGAMGTDIAIEAADIALMGDDIDKLPHVLDLSKRTLKKIKVNITISMGINLIAIALASLGLMGPVVGALVHNVGSVLVIANSTLLLKYHYKA